jgi:hypothetical protein
MGKITLFCSHSAGRCSNLGAAAYAHKKVAMYSQLQNDCKSAYTIALEQAAKINATVKLAAVPKLD